MSAPKSPQQADWQPRRIPKLSYRKAIPKDELEQINYAPRDMNPQVRTATQTDSFREPATNPTTAASTHISSKKKGSILSGFFSKEPTLSALAQVEADLTAKHGAATAQSVPHVSSRKMPEYVPKVNSRWDGVPETIKSRDREEKQRKRLSQQGPVILPHYSIRSQNSDGSMRATMRTQQSGSRRDSDTSHADSWPSQNEKLVNLHRPGSLSSATSSENSNGAEVRQASSTKSQSLRSPSGSSLPEITSFFPHHQQNGLSKATDKAYHGSVIGAIPEHSSSPASTPRETSPVTPLSSADRIVPLRSNVTDTGVSRGNTTTRPLKARNVVPMDAFLAGEARPVEVADDIGATKRVVAISVHDSIRDDTNHPSPQLKAKSHNSKNKLEARTNGVNRLEAAPWEARAPPKSTSVSANARQRGPKVLGLVK